MDSPMGLAGWIAEKRRSWSNSDGNLETAFPKDELRTYITLYRVTQTINSANRINYEAMQALNQSLHNPLMRLNPWSQPGSIRASGSTIP